MIVEFHGAKVTSYALSLARSVLQELEAVRSATPSEDQVLIIAKAIDQALDRKAAIMARPACERCGGVHGYHSVRCLTEVSSDVISHEEK